jgi:hypothetical protein
MINFFSWLINIPAEQENRLEELREEMNLKLGENPRRWVPHFSEEQKPKRVKCRPLFETWRPHIDKGFKNGVH